MRREYYGCVARSSKSVKVISLTSIPLGPDVNGDDTDQLSVEGYSPFDERDLPGGYVARFKLYSDAWNACFDRVQVRVVPLIRSVPMFATWYFSIL